MYSKMKVIIANGGFLPAKTYGGPVVSIDNLCAFLHEHIDFYVVCTDHELGEQQRLEGISEGWNDRGNCKVRYFPDTEVTENNLSAVIEEIQPDTIYINSLFDAMWTIPLLRIAKRKNIKIVLAPRGQLCKNAFTGKYKKIPYILYLKTFGLLKNIQFQSTSDEETEAIKTYLDGIDEDIHFLTNIPSMPKVELSHHHKVSGKANFVFFSRIVPKKNLLSAIKYFDSVNGDASFDIYGPIEDESYWNECQEVISKLPQNITVNYKGIIDHDHVFETLSQYDAFLFPTWSENFGHVISEALFSECPVIISSQTPWRGLEEVGAGWDIELNNSKEFTQAIMKVIQMDDVEQLEMRRRAKKYAYSKFNLEKLHCDYVKVLSINDL